MKMPILHTFKNTNHVRLVINGVNWSSLKSVALTQSTKQLTKVEVLHHHKEISYSILRMDDLIWQDIVYDFNEINTEPDDIIEVISDHPINVILTL
jgi:hypothetical protein